MLLCCSKVDTFSIMLQFKRGGQERKLYDAALLEGIIHVFFFFFYFFSLLFFSSHSFSPFQTNLRRYGFRKQRFNSFTLHTLHFLVLFVVFYSGESLVFGEGKVGGEDVEGNVLNLKFVLFFFSFLFSLASCSSPPHGVLSGFLCSLPPLLSIPVSFLSNLPPSQLDICGHCIYFPSFHFLLFSFSSLLTE